MYHKDITSSDNHIPYAFVYASAAARTSATGFVAGDVGKLARQSDNNTLWMLTDTTPTWQHVGGGSTLSEITDWPVAVSATEVGFLDGLSSNIQSQLNAKAEQMGDLSDWPPLVTTTQVQYLEGVTGYIQTQINGKPDNLTQLDDWPVLVTPTDISYLQGLTSNVQSQINAKPDAIADLSDWPVGVSATEVGYLDGVTSAIQTQIDGKASSSHSHTSSDITDFSEAVDDRVSTLLVAGTNVTLTYDDVANTLTIASTASGGGGGASVSMGVTPPADPATYPLWWNTEEADLYIYYNDGTSSQWVVASNKKPTSPAGREILTADRTYYVRTDGNNSNTGLVNSSGGAFLTIQKAIDVACTLDLSIYNVTIQVVDGTYTDSVLLKTYLGTGNISIIGNATTPANCVINTTSYCFRSAGSWTGEYILNGFTLQSSGSEGIGAHHQGAKIRFRNIAFGACSTAHTYAISGSIICDGGDNYSITGASAYHHQATNNGIVRINGATVTITGTPAFTAFAGARSNSSVQATSNTYTGSATGSRYNCTLGGSIDVNGAGTSYLPGSTAGDSTGGYYG